MLVARSVDFAPRRASVSPSNLVHSFATMCLPRTISSSSSSHASDDGPDASPAAAARSSSIDGPSSALGPTKAALSLLLPPYSRRNVFFFLFFCLVVLPVLLYSFHPGVRRTLQFWSAMAPLVAEHKWIQFRNRLDRWSLLRRLRRGRRDYHQVEQQQKNRIKKFHKRAAPRITQKMVDLGGIYIKLGQVLSTVGSGFLDEAYIDALKPLQDGVPPRPYEDIASIIESSTGQSMDALFRDFDENPIGAASIGQAHKAVLRDSNEQVIVKVQYPEVARLFEIDFDNLETAVKWLDPTNTELVDALRKRHENELDFEQEAANLRTIRSNLQKHGVEPTLVRVPVVKNETGICTQNVLVMEYLQGTSLSSAMEQEQNRFAKALGKEDAEELKRILMERMKEHMERGGGAGSGTLQMMGGGSSKLLQVVGPTAARLFRVFAGVREWIEDAAVSVQTTGARATHMLFGRGKVDHAPVVTTRQPRSRFNLGRAIKTLVHVHGLQMIKDGVFNLDCHGGNVLILPDGRLGLLDYGMVGRLNEDDRIRVAETVMALAKRDKEAVARIYTDAGYSVSWKDGNVTDSNILYRLASFHFDRIDLSDITLTNSSLVDASAPRTVGVIDILRTIRERSIPFWIEDGRRLGGLLIGTASQAARPISLANEWRPIAAQVTRKQRR